MKHRNGYLTFFVLWLGIVVCGLAFSSFWLARTYLQKIELYRDAVRASYLAESALHIGIIEYQKEKGVSLPPRRDIRLSEADGLKPGEETYVICKRPEENDGIHGFLTGVARVGAYGMTKTSAVKFTATYDEKQQLWMFVWLNRRT